MFKEEKEEESEIDDWCFKAWYYHGRMHQSSVVNYLHSCLLGQVYQLVVWTSWGSSSSHVPQRAHIGFCLGNPFDLTLCVEPQYLP